MKVADLMIDPEFRDCLPKLSLEEYCQLEQNILRYGIQVPLIIWNGYVVDGHNRHDICVNNNITDVPVKEEHFEDKQEALQWILENQLGRRNLSDFARNEIALRYKDVIARRAKTEADKRRSENYVNQYGAGARSNDQRPKTETTRSEIARIAGTNDSSVKRTEYILNKGNEEEIERARAGGKGNAQATIVREIKDRTTPEGYKECSSCGEVKPVSEFKPCNTHADGLTSRCRTCINEARRKQDVEVEDTVEREQPTMTFNQIKRLLKDDSRETSMTKEDVLDSTLSNVENFCRSIELIAEMDKSAFVSCRKEVRDIIDSHIKRLYKEVF